jgi:hypothetical protein
MNTGLRAVLCAFAVLTLLPAQAPQRTEKVFLFKNASRDVNEFRAFAKIASRLKPYGRVQIDIGQVAERARHELPPGGSPWHEYAYNQSSLAKYFPHPKIAPHLPAEWVAKNRALLVAKAAVLRELGLEAALSSNDTHFLPESFFRQYPHLRGPRVDHPRRSKKEEFAWCVDLAETREMIEWMAAEMKRNVPEIRTVMSQNNDSGSGLCWGAALYSGANGPRHCSGRNAGVRVRDLMLAIQRGFEKGGGKVAVHFGGNFWQNEEDVILPLLPPDGYLSRRDRSSTGVGTLASEAYPVLGLINPLRVLAAMERYEDAATRTVHVSARPSYGRYDEPLETVERLVALVEDSIRNPVHGLIPRLTRLRALSARWGGEQNAERLLEAFCKMDEAMRLKQTIAPKYSNIYLGISARHVTRPLLIRPDLLLPEEERYFLPYIFNIHESEARNDYIDLHGSRITGPGAWNNPGIRNALDTAVSAAATFESLNGAPEQKWLTQLAMSLRIWASEVRSIHNFYSAQMLRDRNKEALEGQPKIPSKLATWEGDRDFIEWTHIQRDEFDNANELSALLEKGGLPYLAHATKPEDEDTFLLGPDVIGALKRKTQLMRDHWLDVQKYLASPLK